MKCTEMPYSPEGDAWNHYVVRYEGSVVRWNGTRAKLRHFGKSVWSATVLDGDDKGATVYVPERILTEA